MYVTTEFHDNIPAVTVHPEGENYPTVKDAVVATYNEFSDPYGFVNEGAPVYYGNSYAVYEFRALIDSEPYTFAFGNDEYANLSLGIEFTLYGEPSTWQAEN